MKKIYALMALSGVMVFSTSSVFAQATRQLNFGFIGINYEIPISDVITIAPAAGTDLNLNHLVIGVKANYYFDDIFGLPSEWDVYGGANAGFGLGIGNNNTNEFNIGLQIGGRWKWNDKWGVYLEAGGGNLDGAGGGIGLTMAL